MEIAALSKEVNELMHSVDAEELTLLLNEDEEFTLGCMYARAVHRGLVALKETGIERVVAAHQILLELPEAEDFDESEDDDED